MYCSVDFTAIFFEKRAPSTVGLRFCVGVDRPGSKHSRQFRNTERISGLWTSNTVFDRRQPFSLKLFPGTIKTGGETNN